ncbi:hypothetical protein AB0N77_21485 [Streptomyces misionensis]|uniref:hypothetical protein n=1 Tax=Streptomyces misionensis TaxID=67331 RepID=UPI00341F5A30
MSGDDEVLVLREDLEILRRRHGPAHPDVVERTMQLAERLGEAGDARAAAICYQKLGDSLRLHLGPYDGRVLDAYEGMARWVGSNWAWPPQARA